MSRAVRTRTYKVWWGYKRTIGSDLGNNARAIRLWVKGILQVTATSKVSAKLEGVYFLKSEFAMADEITVFRTERR